jgi:transcription initiation factor TFIID subunit 5
MSRSGFSLLVGWLTEGIGGEALGSGEGFSGERGKRGRAAVMRVVNNHLRFDGESTFMPCPRPLCSYALIVTSANTTSVTLNSWEESTGLLSSLIPQTSSASAFTSPQAFNSSKADLKLGPAPIPEELRIETERVLREQAVVDRDPTSQYDFQFLRPAPLPGMTAPEESDLLPHPPTFKTIDVQREVERVRDARKRIRLEPSGLNNVDLNSPQAGPSRMRALPSVCGYTLHDVPEGYVFISQMLSF